jgi:hypothetical protein
VKLKTITYDLCDPAVVAMNATCPVPAGTVVRPGPHSIAIEWIRGGGVGWRRLTALMGRLGLLCFR